MKESHRLSIVAILTMSLIGAPLFSLNAASPSPSPSNPYGGIAVDPLGPNETILVISKGKIVKKLSLNDLQKLKPTVISIYEPFVRTRQKFTVVKLSSLFNLAGIKSTDKVSTVALNDYVYANTASSFINADGYLAFKRNGISIPYDQGGPIRIVYPDKSRWAKFLDPWNWSLKRISAK